MLFILVLAATLSIDALGVGVTYGLRGIRTSLGAVAAVFGFSVAYSYLAIFAGNALCSVLPANLTKIIGSLILCAMGAWIVFSSYRPRKKKPKATDASTERPLAEFILKSFGVTIRIIKNPQLSDVDHSGTIDFKEAIALGLALSIDILGAGIGLSMIGAGTAFMPWVIGTFQSGFLMLGCLAGRKISGATRVSEKTLAAFSGLVMMALGIIRLL